MTGLLAADTGFSFADPFAVGVLFIGVAVFAAVGALSHQHERAFSASLIYLVLGAGAAAVIHFSGIGWIDPVGPVVPETPTVPADPVPGPIAPDTPSGPDAPEPNDPLPPAPDGPDVPAPDPGAPETLSLIHI